MKTRSRLTGLEQLTGRLDAAFNDRVMQMALRSAGEEVLARARRKLTALGTDAGEQTAKDLKLSLSADGLVQIGSEHPGAGALEFGDTSQPPQPWLQPAFEEALPSVRERLRKALSIRFAKTPGTS